MVHFTRKSPEINIDDFLSLHPRYILALDKAIGLHMLILVPKNMFSTRNISSALMAKLEDTFFMMPSRDNFFSHQTIQLMQQHGAHMWSPGVNMEFRQPKNIGGLLFHVVSRMNSDVASDDIARIADDLATRRNNMSGKQSVNLNMQSVSCRSPMR